MTVSDRSVVVTGAASGIDRTPAQALAEQGGVGHLDGLGSNAGIIGRVRPLVTVEPECLDLTAPTDGPDAR